jgi:titin
MPLSFPSSPTVGQTSTQNGRSYTYAGNNVWELTPASGGGGSDEARWDFFKPPAPTDVAAVANNAGAVVSWTPTTVLAQVPIITHALQLSSNNGSTWSTFAETGASPLGTSVTGLTNGTSYRFRVAGINGIGQGAWSAASSAVTPQAPVFVAIPSMTSATAPSGVATTNLAPELTAYWREFIYGGGGADFWRVFDGSGNPGLKVNSADAGVTGWVQYAFPSGQVSAAGGYRIKARTPDSGQAPPSLALQISSDGTNWTTVDSRTGLSWSADESKTFTLSVTQTSRYWRWTISPGSSGYADVGDIQLIAP